MHLSNFALAIGLLAPLASSHGIYTKPYPRAPGPLSLAACGPTVINNIKGDNTSHVEGLPEAAMADTKYNAAECNLWLCRGLKLEESQKANVLALTPGQKISMNVKIAIKHHGTANVSVVSTKSNKIIQQLLYWDKYADERLSALPANNTAFDVIIPTTLGSQCANAGDCVIQWWWYGVAAKQTYESCIDFTLAPMSMPMKEKRFEA